MTLDEFVNKWLGKKADYDGAYGGQCVDLFRFYIKEVLGNPQPKGVEGAADFWGNYASDPNLNTYYDKISNTPNGVPQAGDIVLWTRRAGGGYGHVSIFLNGDVNGFTSLDQNWPTLSKVTKTDHNYINVYGWLRPKEKPMASELEACMADRKKFWAERDEARADLEACKTQSAGYQSRATDLGNQVGTLQAEVDNRKEQLSRQVDETARIQELLDLTDKSLQTALSNYDLVSKEKGVLAIENGQLRQQLETALKQGKFTLTIGKLLKALWNQQITIGGK